MSHELRTPLHAILGFTQMMTGDQTLSAKHQENLEVINSSGEHLLRLIDDVLEMSRIEADQTGLNPVRFDLHRLIEGLEGMFRLRAEEKDLQLICHKDPGLPHRVRTDEAKLLKVLINLLDNAIKFTEKGGVTLRATCDSHRLFFEVEDSGPGIPQEDMENLFEAFVQPDVGFLAQEGLGLGLPISQQYVRLMDGEITLSSQVGQGSIFRFDVQIELVERPEAGVKQEGFDRIETVVQTDDTPTPPAEADWKGIALRALFQPGVGSRGAQRHGFAGCAGQVKGGSPRSGRASG
jgi:signal transduction histidine kinase